MKNILNFLFALICLIGGTVQAQTARARYGGEPGGTGTSKCSARCFFTSCTIECSNQVPGGGGAICTCAWGFATCACGQGSGRPPRVLLRAQNYLEQLTELLNESGYKSARTAAAMASELLEVAEKGDSGAYEKKIQWYNEQMYSLPVEVQQKVEELFERLSKEEGN